MSIFHKLDEVEKRFQHLTDKLADPAIYDNPDELMKVNSERSSLEEVVKTYLEFKKIQNDIGEAKEILSTEKDEELREMAKMELQENEGKIVSLQEELKILLLPKDPLDDKNVMVEIRAGAGGDEASIFVADCFRMYQNYLRNNGFKTEVVSISPGSVGVKEVIFSVSGDRAYSKLKYESGVHRVQRVPQTESQGRVHTSTITVAIMPEADEVEFELDMNEVRIDVYRAGGHGGQSVNTTDSAVRATHEPTGIAVAIQDEKSQHKNKDKALKILRNRLFDIKIQEAKAKESADRKGQVGTGDRSERIRTYNFPQGRLTDHRIGLTLYSLDKIIEGELEQVIGPLIAHNQAELLKGQEDSLS